MDNLSKNIDDEINKIINLDFDNTKELEFFKEYVPRFFKVDASNNFDNYLEKDSYEYNVNLFLLCYQSFYKDNDFKRLKQEITKNKLILTTILDNSNCEMDFNFDTLFKYYQNDLYSIPKKLDDLYPLDCFQLNLSINNDTISGTIFESEKYQETIKRMILITFFKFDAENEISNWFNLKCSKANKYILENEYITKNYKNQLFKEEKVKKFLDNIYKSLFRNQNMDNVVNTIETYYKNLISDYNKYVIKQHKMLDKYLYLKKYLQKFNNMPKKVFDVEFNSLIDIDDHILLQLYQKGIDINNIYYQELLEKKQQLTREAIRLNKMKLITSGYNINKISNEQLNFLLHYSNIENLIQNILFINKLDYKLLDIYSNTGIYILVNTNIDILTNINNLIEKHVITPSLLEKYPQIFLKKDIISGNIGLYDTLCDNVRLLNNYYNVEDENINELLIYDSKIVNNNIKALKSYSSILNIDILKNIRLLDNIDLLIELGLADYIDDNINLIDENSILMIKRIYIAQMMHLEIIKNQKINNMLLTGNNFYVQDSKLDDYIIDNTLDYIPNDVKTVLEHNLRNNMDLTNIDLSLLDDNVDDELTYKIDDILISKNKIIRNYNCLLDNIELTNMDRLFYSMIYGSFLSKQQIKNIKDIIYTKNKKYVK